MAVVVAVLGAVVFAGLLSATNERSDVLAVARPVAVGDRISAADLAVAEVSASDALRPVPAAERDRIVGRRAAVGLVPGTLLTEEAVAPGPVLDPGKATVGLSLKPGRFPLGIAKGQRVILVLAAVGRGEPPTTHEGTVVAVGDGALEGDRVLSVLVAQASVAEVAVAAGDGRVSVASVG
ncbi:MAG: SAF domain-containing protein [Actinomycetota bacterium]|nr:SAF domain-containing protein [Actinomycetota bacterium]